MVISKVQFFLAPAWNGVWLVAQGGEPIPFFRLPPQMQAKVLAALAAFGILLVGMCLLTWLGARVARRYMSPAPRPSAVHGPTRDIDEDWTARPLIAPSEKPPVSEKPL